MTKYRHPDQQIELFRQDQKILWALGEYGKQIATLDYQGVLAWKRYEYNNLRAMQTYWLEQDLEIEELPWAKLTRSK